jgi:hypothetical protein
MPSGPLDAIPEVGDIDGAPHGPRVVEMVDRLTVSELTALTGVPLAPAAS